MNFAASIKKGSPVDRLWRGQRRLSGELHGLRFHLVGTFQAGTYQTSSVPPGHVPAMQNHASVQLEAMDVAPDVAPADAPPEEDDPNAPPAPLVPRRAPKKPAKPE